MTVSTYLGLDTALSALQTDQEALDTTSNNIANASTPGYTEERVNFNSTPAYDIAGGYTLGSTGLQIGTGVDAGSITRVRSNFLDGQYRTQNAASANATEEASDLGQAQTALDEPSANGISSQLQSFWSAWNDLANNPTNLSSRQSVVDAGTSLADSFNSLSSSLTTLQSEISANYSTLTGSGGQVASDANQIASLNTQIAAAQQAGQTPNTLLDQRDQVLDNLSSLANITVGNQPNGMVSVQFGDAATPLVSATNMVTWPQTLTAAAGGQLGAMLNFAGPSGQIAGYETQLDNAASKLISSVNSLSSTTPFFSGNSASTIAVSATASTVETSSTSDSGGNDVATAIAALSGGAPDQAYSAFVSQVGSDVQSAQKNQSLAGAVVNATSQQRESVDGVSLDQEMTNLITYQQAYQAAARVMTTMDSTLDTLINHTVSVGL